MRNLIVRFSNEGDYVSELAGTRNYFFEEANQLIEEIKGEYASVQKQIEFEFPVLKQRYNAVMELNSEFDLKQALLKAIDTKVDKETLNTILYEEGEVFKDDAFCVFAKRYDFKLGQPKLNSFPYLLSANHMYGLFESARDVYGHLFFSNMENVIHTIEGLLGFITTLPKSNDEITLEQREKFFYSFVEQESNYEKMKNYIQSNLQSLSINSIDALYPKFNGYQTFEKLLFSRLPSYIGHEKCMELHDKVLENYYLRFHIELFEGRVLNRNTDFEMYVFNPVMLEMYKLLDVVVNKHVRETGIDKGALLEDINRI